MPSYTPGCEIYDLMRPDGWLAPLKVSNPVRANYIHWQIVNLAIGDISHHSLPLYHALFICATFNKMGLDHHPLVASKVRRLEIDYRDCLLERICSAFTHALILKYADSVDVLDSYVQKISQLRFSVEGDCQNIDDILADFGALQIRSLKGDCVSLLPFLALDVIELFFWHGVSESMQKQALGVFSSIQLKHRDIWSEGDEARLIAMYGMKIADRRRGVVSALAKYRERVDKIDWTIEDYYTAKYRGSDLQAMMVQVALNAGSDVSMRFAKNRTLLHGCTNPEVADLLLRWGADRDALDEEGNTPLHVAVRHEDVSMVSFFCNRGAIVSVKNQNGQTPPSLALETANDEMLEVFHRKFYLQIPKPPSPRVSRTAHSPAPFSPLLSPASPPLSPSRTQPRSALLAPSLVCELRPPIVEPELRITIYEHRSNVEISLSEQSLVASPASPLSGSSAISSSCAPLSPDLNSSVQSPTQCSPSSPSNPCETKTSAKSDLTSSSAPASPASPTLSSPSSPPVRRTFAFHSQRKSMSERQVSRCARICSLWRRLCCCSRSKIAPAASTERKLPPAKPYEAFAEK